MAKGIHSVSPVFQHRIGNEPQARPTKKANTLFGILLPATFVVGVVAGMSFLTTVHEENKELLTMQLSDAKKALVAADSSTNLAVHVANYYGQPDQVSKRDLNLLLEQAARTQQVEVVTAGSDYTVVSVNGKQLHLPFQWQP